MRTYVLIGHPHFIREELPFADGCFVLCEGVEMSRAVTTSGGERADGAMGRCREAVTATTQAGGSLVKPRAFSKPC
jgi:hypothetical protein